MRGRFQALQFGRLPILDARTEQRKTFDLQGPVFCTAARLDVGQHETIVE